MSNLDGDGLTPEQCRAARALLGWSQTDLEKLASIARKTLTDFEAGKRRPYARTLVEIRQAFEAFGVEFIGPGQASQSGGPGVRLKCGQP